MVRNASQTISTCAGASGSVAGSSRRDGHCQRICPLIRPFSRAGGRARRVPSATSDSCEPLPTQQIRWSVTVTATGSGSRHRRRVSLGPSR
ncbi:hypothetical protein [Micromonospora tarensis]|uniref:hypothetical protein n=1 Tax=Micromonospora tarensis TaxID=2806100 RepID=UPI001EE3FAEE